MARSSFREIAINIAKAVSSRSEDLYKKVGCCILDKEGRILSVGYNGLQPKQKIKQKFWTDREDRRKYIIHAETNALSSIARCDKPYLLASTLLPCSCCAMNIASYGIKEVLYSEDYDKDLSAIDIFKFYKINLIRYNK